MTNNKRLQNIEAERGGRRYEELKQRRSEQFTGVALKRTGTDANRVTPEMMYEASARIGV